MSEPHDAIRDLPLAPAVSAAAESRAFAEVYRANAQLVARWAARLGGPGTDVEDVVQEVFLIAHQGLKRFRGEGKISTWLFAITRNVLRRRFRRERLGRLFAKRTSEEGNIAPPRPTPVEDFERREAERLVYEAMKGLNEKQRTVFALYEIEGLSGPEIAELTGLHPTTLRVLLFRARARFEATLREMGVGEGRA